MFSLIKLSALRAEAETRMEAKDQDLDAYRNRPIADAPDTEYSEGRRRNFVCRTGNTVRRSGSGAGAENDAAGPNSRVHGDDSELADPRIRGSGPGLPVRQATTSAMSVAEPLPESIARETCSICFVYFEEGENLCVPPCKGKHVFHQAWADPWLLELLSSCPICQHGTNIRFPKHFRSALAFSAFLVRFPGF